MEISQTEQEITFTFPRFAKRWNLYDEEDDYGSYPTFTGLIIRHRENGSDWDEMGFAGTIDMAYKDKSDQVSEIIVAWDGSEESFIEKCKELDINLQELTFN